MNYANLSTPGFRLRGFTIIELMITVAILAVLLALAAPSFQAMIASSRLTTATNDLIAAFAQARSNAIKVGNRTTVCMSADGASCTDTGGWHQGWISFVDTTRSGTSAAVDTGETVATIYPPLPAGIVVNGNLPYISYSADGQSKAMSGGGFWTGTIRVCSTSSALTNDKRARNLTLNSAGRITMTVQSNVADTCPSP
ncbi:GspH/FimT family pseudopilin [Rhodoferax sp. AJA081-3]|uniref:GspH/FimT family pseudopilin n=1 Tax=Rhodoferax sp. AJA081-3 TaxID=2752316 RepID=UPI001AE09EF9|nr:GspH/FimT family pseudopilin [Rhodoferax sp. AJA081-3]QTN29281.1 GspH/FimT family pseudopilin [Rhodoferax sp. AJA081-3]